MKLTSWDRTHSAAMIRSPSFSRSSSSMITAIFPRRRSSRISSIVLNAMCALVDSPPVRGRYCNWSLRARRGGCGPPPSGFGGWGSRAAQPPPCLDGMRHQPIQIPPHDVDLDVHLIADPKLAERGNRMGMRNDVHVELQPV